MISCKDAYVGVPFDNTVVQFPDVASVERYFDEKKLLPSFTQKQKHYILERLPGSGIDTLSLIGLFERVVMKLGDDEDRTPRKISIQAGEINLAVKCIIDDYSGSFSKR